MNEVSFIGGSPSTNGLLRPNYAPITGHQTESVYTRYAIASAQEQREALKKVAATRRR